jgi:hypothetical protein
LSEPRFLDLEEAIGQVLDLFRMQASRIKTDTWQGYSTEGRPEMEMHEVLRVSFSALITSEERYEIARQVQPNLPWADDHFRERVSGQPLNPGEQWKHWPWGLHADKSRVIPQQGGQMQFNHTYMERYWPRHAGVTVDGELPFSFMGEPRQGIRFEYGDLNSVLDLLERDPFTRQAWIPIFHPEDTGIGDGGRKPCSLGYQFILRGKHLSVYYPLRSCDIYRHMRDDIYLTVMLLLWVIRQLRLRDGRWEYVKPGMLWMWMTSLHCFRNDWRLLFGKDADEPA